MKKTLIFAIFCTTGCDAPTSVAVADDSSSLTGGPLAVYLVEGQSNAVGGARISDLPPELQWYGDPVPEIPFAREINCPKDWSTGACASSTGWAALAPRTINKLIGIEMSAGRRVRDRFGEDVALIKHATDGTNLYGHWDSTDPRFGLWERSLAYIDARLAEQPAGSHVAGLFWIQGEGDAASVNPSGDYAENLAWLILRMRQEYGCVPVVINRLHPDLDPVAYPYAQTVRDEEDAVAQYVDDVVIVDTDDLTLRSDFTHYTSQSYITLGERMADAMPSCP